MYGRLRKRLLYSKRAAPPPCSCANPRVTPEWDQFSTNNNILVALLFIHEDLLRRSSIPRHEVGPGSGIREGKFVPRGSGAAHGWLSRVAHDLPDDHFARYADARSEP